jgi:hypothetical protein
MEGSDFAKLFYGIAAFRTMNTEQFSSLNHYLCMAISHVKYLARGTFRAALGGQYPQCGGNNLKV